MALEAAKPEPTKKYGLWELISFVSSFNRGEKMWMVIGIIWSVICGGGSPVGAGKSRIPLPRHVRY
jgi:ATP-binding cassette subfamily B (MDR/TAP) protein 1